MRRLNGARSTIPAIVSLNIFVDESGTFLPSPGQDSWSVVVAYVSPEVDRGPLERLVTALRLERGAGAEVKLNALDEPRYAQFLADLAKLHGIAYSVATATHLHSEEGLARHRDEQAAKVVENIERMHHESARQGLRDLADAIRKLPVQLYTQLVCQVELLHNVLCTAITYYALRYPATLGKIRWRIDRKDVVRTPYEEAFRMVLPALLQTKSHSKPMIMIKDAGDYGHFKRYEFPPGEAPTFLKDKYGIESSGDVSDLGKMIRDDFQFVDSSAVAGVQAADLLASGLRRALRRRFDHPNRIALLLGANMLQAEHRKPPVQLIALSVNGDTVSDDVTQVLRSMTRLNKGILPRQPR